MIHADADLARRLEHLISGKWRDLAALAGRLWPEKHATYIDVAGGAALWIGEGGVINVAAGIGMDGPVGDDDIRRIEDFYARRGVPPMLATCPFADPTLFSVLGRRGWQVTEFENVLALEPAAYPVLEGPPPGVELRVCTTPEERELFGRTAARGFTDAGDPGVEHIEFGEIMAADLSSTLVLALVDGRPAGTGSVELFESGVAWLSADTTLPEFRGRGIQQAVQRFRVGMARDAGCALAVIESAPGSGSQRNMERLGFRVVYPHLQFARV